MPKPTNLHAKYPKRELAARQRALEKDPLADRILRLEAEARWQKLIRRSNFSTRVNQLAASQAVCPQRPCCPACAVAMPLTEVQVCRGAIEYSFECKVCGCKMNIARSDD